MSHSKCLHSHTNLSLAFFFLLLETQDYVARARITWSDVKFLFEREDEARWRERERWGKRRASHVTSLLLPCQSIHRWQVKFFFPSSTICLLFLFFNCLTQCVCVCVCVLFPPCFSFADPNKQTKKSIQPIFFFPLPRCVSSCYDCFMSSLFLFLSLSFTSTLSAITRAKTSLSHSSKSKSKIALFFAHLRCFFYRSNCHSESCLSNSSYFLSSLTFYCLWESVTMSMNHQ